MPPFAGVTGRLVGKGFVVEQLRQIVGDLGITPKRCVEPRPEADHCDPAQRDHEDQRDEVQGKGHGESLGVQNGEGHPAETTRCPSITSCAMADSAPFERLDQLRHDLVHVTDDAQVGDTEDRCLRVLVDRDDVLWHRRCRRRCRHRA